MLGETTNRIYLSIGYGRIRHKCSKDNPKAVERETKSGDKTYAIEHTFVSGTLESVYYKEHHEYGNSWNILLSDGETKYCLQISEKSRDAVEFLKRLPNLSINQFYRFTPYDFKDGEKRRRGLSIKDKADQSINSYYQSFEQDGEKTVVKNLHNFPEPESPPKDSDDWKVYFIKVGKFLREKSLEHLKQIVNEPTKEPEQPDDIPMGDEPPADNSEDLPF